MEDADALDDAGSEDVDGDEAAEPENGCVYFIETDNKAYLKIGYTASLDKRMKQIEGTLRPTPIRLLGYLRGNRATEAWMHAAFAGLRERGEWFRCAQG